MSLKQKYRTVELRPNEPQPLSWVEVLVVLSSSAVTLLAAGLIGMIPLWWRSLSSPARHGEGWLLQIIRSWLT